MFARTGGRGAAQPEKKVVDLKADVMYPIEFRDTSAVCLVGNVAFYHSGAVITCDSAVRYSEKHMECFGNVLINKNDTYVYGDRADYNGETHVANVYSDLVKVVDGDATLYTYKFLFNTKTNVGEFADGGVVTNRENQLESDRGYYYANDRTVICVDRVEIRSEEYDLTGDSVVYNLTTDHAYYFRHTNIWNTQGDYLYADRGSYDKGGELYTVTENGYILTEKQEVWSDSIDYYKLAGHAVLRGNIAAVAGRGKCMLCRQIAPHEPCGADKQINGHGSFPFAHLYKIHYSVSQGKKQRPAQNRAGRCR